MKQIVTILTLVLLGSFNLFAQKGDYELADESNFMDRVYVGGGLGLSGGSWGGSVSISPIVGYMVSNRLSVGVGATYQYYKYNSNTPGISDYSDNRYGGSVFARMNLVRQVFAYGEYSFLNYSINGDSNNRDTAYRLPIGLGFSQSMGARSSFNIVAAYDMLYEINGPYGSPWVFTFFFSI